MDLHQKISIGVFGALLLGTMAMFSMGGLSSSAINTDTSLDTTQQCSEAYMKGYAEKYTSDKAKIAELQQFITANCGEEVVASKKSYCEARIKQVDTYSARVKQYEQCRRITRVKTK